MNWSRKYIQWKRKIKLDEISSCKQMFFKTNPTNEQLLILDNYQREMNVIMGLIYFLGIISGIITSYVVIELFKLLVGIC